MDTGPDPALERQTRPVVLFQAAGPHAVPCNVTVAPKLLVPKFRPPIETLEPADVGVLGRSKWVTTGAGRIHMKRPYGRNTPARDISTIICEQGSYTSNKILDGHSCGRSTDWPRSRKGQAHNKCGTAPGCRRAGRALDHNSRAKIVLTEVETTHRYTGPVSRSVGSVKKGYNRRCWVFTIPKYM